MWCFKVHMKWIFGVSVLKLFLLNIQFQSLRWLVIKAKILQDFKVEPFCPQKLVVFESHNQNTTWQQPLTSFWCQKLFFSFFSLEIAGSFLQIAHFWIARHVCHINTPCWLCKQKFGTKWCHSLIFLD